MSKERIRSPALKKKIVTADKAAKNIKDGMTVATSGFARAGYPKAVPQALAEHIKVGRRVKINLWTGASVGEELDGALSAVGALGKRLPYQSVKSIRKHINSREVQFIDYHLSHTPEQIRYGYFGDLDIAIVEATAITEDGYIIPTTSVGSVPTFVQKAEKIIIEVNKSQPLALEGVHDIYVPQDPPHRKAIPVEKPDQRIGKPYVEVDPDKIIAVVETSIPDNPYSIQQPDKMAISLARRLCDFLKEEVKKGRLPANLLPIQGGVGTTGNAMLDALSEFDNLYIYSEVLQDKVFELMDKAKVAAVSGTAITLSPFGQERIIKDMDKYRERLILRPQEISNHPEVIRRLGLIAINTAVEVDIYGHVNSSHAMGVNLINGIGGSGDFARNGALSIFVTPSTMKDGKISCIVPMVTHVDHTEHDVMVVITEQGVADLRNLAPWERAEALIENCAHPDYRPALINYVERATKEVGGYSPHLLQEAFSWHLRFKESGSMK